MDLNELLYHHQMALMSVSRVGRDAHAVASVDLPLYYVRRIGEYREMRGLTGNLVMAGAAPDSARPFSRAEPDRYVGDMLPATQPAIPA